MRNCQTQSAEMHSPLVIRNQFKFQAPPMAKMLKKLGPASRLTACEIVTQLCQSPAAGKLMLPHTGVPPALSNWKLPSWLSLETLYSTVYTPRLESSPPGRTSSLLDQQKQHSHHRPHRWLLAFTCALVYGVTTGELLTLLVYLRWLLH